MNSSGLKMVVFVSLVLLIVPCLSYAQSDTGLGGCCGAFDPNYSVLAAPPGVPLGPARSATPPFPGWATSGPNWINPWGNPTMGLPAPTSQPYIYETKFSLTTPFEIDGEMAADNGACLYANASPISCTSSFLTGFRHYIDFAIPAANLHSGLNSLDFNVNNIGGPTGLSVHFYLGCDLTKSIYTDLPANGTVEAWTITGDFVVSDTFTVTGQDSIDGFCFYLWSVSGSVPQTVELSITSSEFGGTSYFDSIVNLTCSSYCKSGYPMHGSVCGGTTGSYDVWACKTQAPVNLAGGTYWINLQDALTSTGDPAFWDQAAGNGCPGNACPSLASENEIGTIPAESFVVNKP